MSRKTQFFLKERKIRSLSTPLTKTRRVCEGPRNNKPMMFAGRSDALAKIDKRSNVNSRDWLPWADTTMVLRFSKRKLLPWSGAQWSPLCVALCRLREADWLNSMHVLHSKECAIRREDGTRMWESISTVCNNFDVIVEGNESAETAVYGIAFVHARNNKPHRGTDHRSSSGSRPRRPRQLLDKV